MNNISDKNVIIVVLVTILIVFSLIFSVKSPERKIIDSPLMWKDEYINSSNLSDLEQYKSFYIIYNS